MNKLVFPEDYFEDEVRGGFYVTGMMKLCWAAQLEVLSEIDRVCEKHGLRWFADCGTLLGAVRHGGFIPWDDDLDICMMRKDYDCFCRVARRELPEGYVVRDHHEADYRELLLRVNNSLFLDFSEEQLEKYHQFPFIAGVDIFPIDRMAPPEQEKKWKEQITFAFSLTAQKDLEEGGRMSRETRLALKELERMTGKAISGDHRVKEQVFDRLTELFSKYRDGSVKEVILTPYWIKDGSHRYQEEWFSDIVELPFETGTIKAPARYDAILETEYGPDYMRPVRFGGVHDYPYYEEQEKMLKEANQGFYPFWYDYDEMALQKAAAARESGPKKKIEEFVNVLSAAQEEAARLFRNRDDRTAVELLTQSQTLAIQLGTLIESLYGEGFETVKQLEAYCEAIYQTSQGMIPQEALKEAWMAVGKSIKERITLRKEIVFLPWKADAWETMKGAWRAACEDPNADVFVIPVPYYKKKAYNIREELRYEGDSFPEEVMVTRYEDYDIAKRCPDEIVIQNPYDGCSYTSTVHPFFYAENLRKYTDRLVYIPWFETDEVEAGDGRAEKSMAHYVSVPGVVYADIVYLPTERKRKTYADFLTRWAGEKTRPLWEEKLQKNPWKRENGIPENDGRKRILYFTSISRMLEYKETMLEKLHRVFDIFSANKDRVELVWRPDPLIGEVLPERFPGLWEKFCALKQQFCEDAVGILDEGPEPSGPAETAAAFYGDPCCLIQRFRERKLPVMLEDVGL